MSSVVRTTKTRSPAVHREAIVLHTRYGMLYSCRSVPE